MVDLNQFANLYKNNIDNNFLSKYDFIITLGAYIKDFKSDICIHPFLDSNTNLYIRYEAGTEEGVSALFLYDFYKGDKLNKFISELDYGYLTSETNISEEEMSHLQAIINQSKNPLLLIGSDFYINNKSNNIINILSYIAEDSNINILLLSQNKKSIYRLNNINKSLENINHLPENNGCIIYLDYEITSCATLKISNEFSKVWKLQDKDMIEISFDDFKINAQCILDETFGGVIGILNYTKILNCGYRYKQVSVKKR